MTELTTRASLIVVKVRALVAFTTAVISVFVDIRIDIIVIVVIVV